MEPDQIGALKAFVSYHGPRCLLQRTTIASEFLPAQPLMVATLSRWLDAESTLLIQELTIANRSSVILLPTWFENADLVDDAELDHESPSWSQIAVSIPLIAHRGRLALVCYRYSDFGNHLSHWFIGGLVRKLFHREWMGATTLGPVACEPLERRT